MNECRGVPAYRTRRSAGRSAQEKETTVYFSLACSTCGRPLKMSIALLGQQVMCPHCGAAFRSHGRGAGDRGTRARTNLVRAAQLLDRLALQAQVLREDAPQAAETQPLRGRQADDGSAHRQLHSPVSMCE